MNMDLNPANFQLIGGFNKFCLRLDMDLIILF